MSAAELENDLATLEKAMRIFFQTMKRPHNWAQVTAKAGISIDRPAAVILHCLATSTTGGSRVYDLAQELGVEAPSVTRKTQELEHAGLLQRVADSHDRRAVSLQITAAGRLVNKRLWKAQREIISQAMQDWLPEERRQFVVLFDRFSHDIAKLSSHNS